MAFVAGICAPVRFNRSGVLAGGGSSYGWMFHATLTARMEFPHYVGASPVREAPLVAKETFAEMRAEDPATS